MKLNNGKVTAEDVLKEGGPWLGAVRSWMQRRKINGAYVEWDSNEVLLPHVTTMELEEAAAAAIAAFVNQMGAVPPSWRYQIVDDIVIDENGVTVQGKKQL